MPSALAARLQDMLALLTMQCMHLQCQQCGLEYWRGNGKGKPDEELCKKYQIERGSYFYPEANQEGSAEIAKVRAAAWQLTINI